MQLPKASAVPNVPVFFGGTKTGGIFDWEVATQIFCIFIPNPGEMIQFDLRIFFKWVGEKPPTSTSWWFQTLLIFTPIWGRLPLFYCKCKNETIVQVG